MLPSTRSGVDRRVFRKGKRNKLEDIALFCLFIVQDFLLQGFIL